MYKPVSYTHLDVYKRQALIDLGVELDIIKKSGAWYSWGEERLGQGKENVREYLKDNPKVTDTIEKQIREAFNLSIKNDDGAGPDNGCLLYTSRCV